MADTDETLCKKVPNTASVVWTNVGTGEATATTEVLCPDIKVTKDGNGPLSAGDVATFTIKVENIGPGTARAVTLTDHAPGRRQLGAPAGCTISATGLLECKLGDDQARRRVRSHDHRLGRHHRNRVPEPAQPGQRHGRKRTVRQAHQQQR